VNHARGPIDKLMPDLNVQSEFKIEMSASNWAL
jgi:hypothetical protein